VPALHDGSMQQRRSTSWATSARIAHALPFVRAIRDPFGTLAASTAEDVIRRRSVQLRIREFTAAD